MDWVGPIDFRGTPHAPQDDPSAPHALQNMRVRPPIRRHRTARRRPSGPAALPARQPSSCSQPPAAPRPMHAAPPPATCLGRPPLAVARRHDQPPPLATSLGQAPRPMHLPPPPPLAVARRHAAHLSDTARLGRWCYVLRPLEQDLSRQQHQPARLSWTRWTASRGLRPSRVVAERGAPTVVAHRAGAVSTALRLAKRCRLLCAVERL